MNLISLKKALGKARAAIKGINNLPIKKKRVFPLHVRSPVNGI